MKTLGTICLLLLVSSLALSCRTAPIPQRPPITVPPGLTANDVRTAILADLGSGPGTDRWYPESTEPGVIYAGYQRKSHQLRVAIEYDETSVRLRIAGSTNLNESNGRIHKHAISWMSLLESSLSRALVAEAERHRLATGDSQPVH
jgi:hypothetical protein